MLNFKSLEKPLVLLFLLCLFPLGALAQSIVKGTVNDEKPWYYNIKQFLQNREYPLGASNRDKKTLRRWASRFLLDGEILYKRNYDMVLLRCVDKQEAEKLMHDVHDGTFGTMLQVIPCQENC